MAENPYDSIACPLPGCGADLYLDWTRTRPLQLVDLRSPAPIPPDEADVGDWKVTCMEGHVVLVPGNPGCPQDDVCQGHCGCDVDHSEESRTFRASDMTRLAALLASLDGRDFHVIEFREDGWTLKHPLACRPNLFGCEVNQASGASLHEQPIELGRFRCDVKDGQLVVGEAVADA